MYSWKCPPLWFGGPVPVMMVIVTVLKGPRLANGINGVSETVAILPCSMSDVTIAVAVMGRTGCGSGVPPPCGCAAVGWNFCVINTATGCEKFLKNDRGMSSHVKRLRGLLKIGSGVLKGDSPLRSFSGVNPTLTVAPIV